LPSTNLPMLAGRYDDGDVICLTGRAVNNRTPLKSERVVSDGVMSHLREGFETRRKVIPSFGGTLPCAHGGQCAGFYLMTRPKNTKCQLALTFVRRGGPLRSTTAELIRVKRHALPDAHWRPTGHPLHAVRLPVIPTRPVQLAHRHQMPGQVLRQPRPLQLPFPILGGGRQRT